MSNHSDIEYLKLKTENRTSILRLLCTNLNNQAFQIVHQNRFTTLHLKSTCRLILVVRISYVHMELTANFNKYSGHQFISANNSASTLLNL